MMVDELMPCWECAGSGGHAMHDGRKIHCMACQGTGLDPDELRHPDDTYNDDLVDVDPLPLGELVAEKEYHPDSIMGQARDKFGLNVGKPQGAPILGQTDIYGQPSFGFMRFAGTGTPMKNPAAEIFRRGNPMDIAWRLLKHG